MKKIILLFLIVFFQSGCMINSLRSQINAIDKASEQNEFVGINKDTEFSISLPRSHDGQFSSIEQLNFVIKSGEYENSNASAIVIKRHDSKTWGILDIYVQKGEQWMKIHKAMQHE